MEKHSFDQSLLSAWKLDHRQYLQQASSLLSAEAIQFGLLGLWQQVYMDRVSFGLDLLPDQTKKVETISNNALKLIQEIISQGSQGERSIRDDVRLLGLVSLCISRSEQLPDDLLENLSLHREAIDIFALSLLHSRSFAIAKLISEVAPHLTEISRTFESLIVYINFSSDPTVNRAVSLSNAPVFMLTPWTEVTELFKSLISIASCLHNYKYQQARLECEQLSSLFPSCPEVRSLYALANYFSADKVEDIVDHDFSCPDPLLLYRAEAFLFTPFDRLIYLSAFGDAPIRTICMPQKLLQLGLDGEFYELRSQLQIQLAHNKENSFDLQSLVSSHTDKLLRSSGYDPFKLALYSAQLKKVDAQYFMHSQVQLEPPLPCELTFVVGLPSPHWSQLKTVLKSVPEYAVIDSSTLLEKLYDRCTNLTGNSYPATLDQLTTEQIFSIRLSYLQNLAICFGGCDKEEVVDFLPGSFQHIGLLAKVFPESRFLAIHPPVRESIIASYLEINGYSSGHATATLSELTAYCYDYAEILGDWSSVLKSRLNVINFSDQTITSEVLGLKEIFALLRADLSFAMPRGSFTVSDVSEASSFLTPDLDEFAEDIDSVNKSLFSLSPR